MAITVQNHNIIHISVCIRIVGFDRNRMTQNGATIYNYSNESYVVNIDTRWDILNVLVKYQH